VTAWIASLQLKALVLSNRQQIKRVFPTCVGVNRTAVATGERPSREQIIRSIAGMSKEDLQWLVGEINQLIGGRR